MAGNILRSLLSMELEEKILNGGALLAVISVFFPWLSGEWLGGEVVSYSGLGFYTSVIGLTVLLFNAYVLLVTAVPLTGGPVLVRKRQKNMVRLLVTSASVLLTLATWSVLTRFTFDFSRLEIHFGLYGTLIGGLVAMLYSYLLFQQERRSSVQEFFSHPEGVLNPLEKNDTHYPAQGDETRSAPSEPEDMNPHRNLFNEKL